MINLFETDLGPKIIRVGSNEGSGRNEELCVVGNVVSFHSEFSRISEWYAGERSAQTKSSIASLPTSGWWSRWFRGRWAIVDGAREAELARGCPN